MPEERIELRDGREFKVTVLPDVLPPKRRSGKTRYSMAEVEKTGDTSHKDWPMSKRKKVK